MIVSADFRTISALHMHLQPIHGETSKELEQTALSWEACEMANKKFHSQRRDLHRQIMMQMKGIEKAAPGIFFFFAHVKTAPEGALPSATNLNKL